jgi:hypothetical protein
MEQEPELTEEQKQANRKQAKERLQYEGKLPDKDGKNAGNLYREPWQ